MKPSVAAAALVAACTSACFGDEGPPNPVPVATVEIPDPAEPLDVRRRVELRNPLGGPPGNLLVDGDFETSIVIEGNAPQSGWLAFGGAGQTYLRGATGGVCRSGLRCGWLEPGVLLLGQGAAAKDSGMIATAWARPAEGFGCYSVEVQVLRCKSFISAANVFPESETPRPDGWCFYRGRVARQTSGTCMLIETALPAEAALVDNAAIVPDTGTVPLGSGVAIPDTSFVPLPAEKRERVRELLEWRRRRLKLGASPEDRPDMGLR